MRTARKHALYVMAVALYGCLPMSIFQRTDRHNQWWVSFRFHGRRVRQKSPIQSHEGALGHEAQLLAILGAEEEIKAGAPLYSGSTFAEFAERWMTDYVMIANRHTTVAEKRYALKSRITPAFGHLPLQEITTGTVDAQVATWVRSGLSIKRT
jgi:hypothetical protein